MWKRAELKGRGRENFSEELLACGSGFAGTCGYDDKYRRAVSDPRGKI